MKSSVVGIYLLHSKNNGTFWLFKRVSHKESWETFKAVRRNWLGFTDHNEAGERAIMSENVMMESLEAEEADVEKSGADEWILLEQTDENKTQDALTQKRESYDEAGFVERHRNKR